MNTNVIKKRKQNHTNYRNNETLYNDYEFKVCVISLNAKFSRKLNFKIRVTTIMSGEDKQVVQPPLTQIGTKSPSFEGQTSIPDVLASTVSVDNDSKKPAKNTRKSIFINSKDECRRPVCYQVLYCIMYLIMGSMFSAAVLVLPYLQETLDIDASQSSLIYSVFYISNIIGSIIAGKIAGQTKFTNTHLYCVCNCLIFGCLCLFLIQFIKSYFLMIINWMLIGLFVSCINVMPCVWICRVYGARGAIIFSRMVLMQTVGSVIFSILYNVKYINVLWYGIITITILCSVMLLFILPTPQEKELIEAVANVLLENTVIEVIEEIS